MKNAKTAIFDIFCQYFSENLIIDHLVICPITGAEKKTRNLVILIRFSAVHLRVVAGSEGATCNKIYWLSFSCLLWKEDKYQRQSYVLNLY